MPFDDLEAIERYGWEVADQQAYPIPIVYKTGEARRPSRADLVWYEAALRAMPIFIRDHLQPDGRADYLPAEVTLSVPTHAGETNVHISMRKMAWPSGFTRALLAFRANGARDFADGPEDEPPRAGLPDRSQAYPNPPAGLCWLGR